MPVKVDIGLLKEVENAFPLFYAGDQERPHPFAKVHARINPSAHRHFPFDHHKTNCLLGCVVRRRNSVPLQEQEIAFRAEIVE